MAIDTDPKSLLRRIVHARSGQLLLLWLSVLEAVVLPIPLEVVMAPYMQMRRDIIWRIAAIGLVGFVAVAIVGYAIGALFFDTLGQSIITALNWQEAFDEFSGYMDEHGFWSLMVVALTPIPVQIGMIGAGAVGYPFGLFVLAMAVARGMRYFGLAALVYLFGDRAARLFDRSRRQPESARQPDPPPR